MQADPVTIVLDDDLRRSRLTVFFRVLLAIPHIIWFAIWSIGVFFAVIFGWFAVVFTGRLPVGLHRFFGSYIRYSTHLGAYIAFVANPYPPFDGGSFPYPLELQLPEPVVHSRWRVALRLPIALPAIMLTVVLGGVPAASGTGSRSGTTQSASLNGGLVIGVFFLGWFSGVFAGRMPRGLRDAGVYALGYRAQTLAYLLLVTDRYPNSDPTEMLAELERPPTHPVRVVGDAHDLRRSRVTVFFRLPLAIPLFLWLVLWTVPAILALFIQWFVVMFRGRPASALHRFNTRYVRFGFHISAFFYLVANPFPGFTGEPGRYPLDLELPEPGRQSRWRTLFRIFLSVPAFILNACLAGALVVAAVLTWFVALFTGKASWGLRNLSAYAIRYSAQLSAYVFLLTETYPNVSPLEGADVVVAPPDHVV